MTENQTNTEGTMADADGESDTIDSSTQQAAATAGTGTVLSDDRLKNAEILHRTTPTLRPTLVFLSVSLLVGLVIIGFLSTNPVAIAGDRQLTNIVTIVIGVLLILLTIRFLIRLFILTRTKYIIRSDVLRREVNLILRHRSREVPVRQLRGHEFSQNWIQALLGFGTIRMLTGGTNQSLGFLEFEDVPDPNTIRDYVQNLTVRSYEGR